MKIVICGSMAFSKEMLDIKRKLMDLGHKVVLPRFTEEYAQLNNSDHAHTESAKNKIEHDLMRKYFYEIKGGDAILVTNYERHKIKNYIGGNSLIEMAFAQVLDKKIFLLNPIPEMLYKDEIIATKPIIIDGDLNKIK